MNTTHHNRWQEEDTEDIISYDQNPTHLIQAMFLENGPVHVEYGITRNVTASANGSITGMFVLKTVVEKLPRGRLP